MKHVVPETCVRMAVLSGREEAIIYRLLYCEVKEIAIQTKNDLFPLENSRFGDWGYDELVAGGHGCFRHNILFQTGTEISITFRKFSFDTQKASARELRQYAVPLGFNGGIRPKRR
jgi:hypothetical protein